MAKGANKVDGALKAQLFSFVQKLTEDDTLPGLHIEPIQSSADPRVRTGRVNLNFRAVLFKLTGAEKESTYVYVGTWPHDEAIARAMTARLTINPVNGVMELLDAEPVIAPTPPPARRQLQPAEPVLVGEAVEATPLLVSQGRTREELVHQLGLDPAVADLALAAASASEIELLAEQAVTWQGLALLELISGYSVEEIKDRLQLGVAPSKPGQATDDDLIDALSRPAARLQFAYIEDDAELRRVIESGDFGAWRTFLHPEQRRYATASYKGPFRLSGGAGTGKTVVLVHRARHLASADPGARILLTTYTTTLADSLHTSLNALDPSAPIADRVGQTGIHVAGVDAVATRILRAASTDDLQHAVATVFGPRGGDILGTTSNDAWREVALSAAGGLETSIAHAAFLEAEYSMVVLPNRVHDREDYVRVRRPGRGVALNRAKRDAVWKAIEAYRAGAAVEGTTDWAEKAAVAAALLERTGPVVDHVLVDEGQDLTPSQWQFLRALAAHGSNDLFLAEDSHQRIYGQPVVLSRYGINIVGRARRLTLNYRTTAQNLAYAVGVLSGAQFVDVEGEAEDSSRYRSARSGPAPQLRAASSLTDELDQAHAVVHDWLTSHPDRPAEAVGILVRDRNKAAQVVTGLADRGIEARHVEGKSVPTGHPVVLTMHRAKGMEFERVLIFGASDRELPAAYLAKDMDAADRADFERRERSLLYVSATRARDELVILWDGQPSTLLPAPPPDPVAP